MICWLVVYEFNATLTAKDAHLFPCYITPVLTTFGLFKLEEFADKSFKFDENGR